MDLRRANDKGVEWISVSRGNLLKRDEDMTGRQNNISALVWLRCVHALGGHLYLKAIARRHHRAGLNREGSDVHSRPIMQAVYFVASKGFEQSFADHSSRPAIRAAHFLCGLEDENNAARKIAGFGKIAGGTQQHGCMPIVPASVHDARVYRTVSKIVALLNRERVHVSAQTNGALAASTPVQDANDAGSANAFADLDPEGPKFVSDELCCLMLLV
nr:hypothetical protein [Sinorhizobium meliloti]